MASDDLWQRRLQSAVSGVANALSTALPEAEQHIVDHGCNPAPSDSSAAQPQKRPIYPEKTAPRTDSPEPEEHESPATVEPTPKNMAPLSAAAAAALQEEYRVRATERAVGQELASEREYREGIEATLSAEVEYRNKLKTNLTAQLEEEKAKRARADALLADALKNARDERSKRLAVRHCLYYPGLHASQNDDGLP